MSYPSIGTHPCIFAAPLSSDEALGNVFALITVPHVRAVAELNGLLDACKHAAGEIHTRSW
jgi:hypothetical protein